jgi:hypothetical protein
LIFAAAAAVFFAACEGSPADNAANTATAPNAAANTAANTVGALAATPRPPGTAPVPEGLLNLDRMFNEAYTGGNAEFFQGVLHDKFVMFAADGTRLDKAAAAKALGSFKCELAKPEYTEPLMTVIGHDVYAISYRAVFDGTCSVGTGGKPVKRPSPVRIGTVWIRGANGNWKAAFRGENLIVEGKAAPKMVAPQKPSEAASPPADPVTAEVLAAERSIWDAWKDRDGARLDVLTSGETGFVNIFGTAFGAKAEMLADWTGSLCTVKSVSLSDAAAVSLLAEVAVLTAKGTADGTCAGQKIGPVLAATVYVKQGPDWKWAFGFNSPAS